MLDEDICGAVFKGLFKTSPVDEVPRSSTQRLEGGGRVAGSFEPLENARLDFVGSLL